VGIVYSFTVYSYIEKKTAEKWFNAEFAESAEALKEGRTENFCGVSRKSPPLHATGLG